MELTGEQAFVVRNLYVTALAPLVVMLSLYLFGKLSKWGMAVYGYACVICAIGWEIWYTYGLVGGLPVYERRAPAMSEAIPLHLNWVRRGPVFIWLVRWCRGQYGELEVPAAVPD